MSCNWLAPGVRPQASDHRATEPGGRDGVPSYVNWNGPADRRWVGTWAAGGAHVCELLVTIWLPPGTRL